MAAMTVNQAFEISEGIRNRDVSLVNNVLFDSVMKHITKEVYLGKHGIVHLFSRLAYPEFKEIPETSIQYVVDKLLDLGFNARRSGDIGIIVTWNLKNGSNDF